VEACIYCGTPRGDSVGCCGENHFEDLPQCPYCDSESVVHDGDYYHCEACIKRWPENEVLETVVLGSAGPNMIAE
jgi:hypothetical protein